MGIDLPILWALIIAFGLMMYVVMDGFDLGIGILFPFIRDRGDRDTLVNTVAPVWDGNETWLVLGGATLMGVFPLAYSVLLSALYIPIFFMLAGLIWRGVAFEFRFKADEAHRPFWDKAFACGSYIATFSQGVALGAFINGFKVTGASYDGGSFDWLSPFSLFTGVGLIVAYALLGCTRAPTQSAGAPGDARPCRGDRHRERMDPAHASEHRDTVVFISQHHHLLAGAGACCRNDLGHDARASERDARIAVPARAPVAVPGLYWFSDQPVAEHHSTGHIDQGSRRAAGQHGLQAGRCGFLHH